MKKERLLSDASGAGGREIATITFAKASIYFDIVKFIVRSTFIVAMQHLFQNKMVDESF